MSICDFKSSRISAVVSMQETLAVELVQGEILGKPDIWGLKSYYYYYFPN